MNAKVQQLLETALNLTDVERLELAEAILAASVPPIPALVGEAYVDEVRRRSTEVTNNQGAAKSWADVKSHVRSRVESRSQLLGQVE